MWHNPMDALGEQELWFAVICVIIDDYFKQCSKYERDISVAYFHGELKSHLDGLSAAAGLSGDWVRKRVMEYKWKPHYSNDYINLGQSILGRWGVRHSGKRKKKK